MHLSTVLFPLIVVILMFALTDEVRSAPLGNDEEFESFESDEGDRRMDGASEAYLLTELSQRFKAMVRKPQKEEEGRIDGITTTRKFTTEQGKKWTSIMYATYFKKGGKGLGQTTNKGKQIMLDLLKEVVKKPLPSGKARTLVGKDGGYYRIDNQFNVDEHKPIVIAYQIGKESVASVEIHLHPLSVPKGEEKQIKELYIDGQKGFTDAEVWECVAKALDYSVTKGLKTRIVWLIEETK